MKWWLVLSFFVLIALCLGALPLWLLEFIFVGLAGWIFFLVRIVGEITVSPSGIVTALLAVTILAMGLHAFAGWLYRQTGEPEEPRQWQPRWTGAILGAVILTFVAGIAAIGVTHQTTWLLTSPEPFLGGGIRDLANKTASQNNLKQATLAVINYADQNGADRPLSVLVDGDGRLLHGWITQILPQMDNDALYKKIALSKPWDDPANREAMATKFRPLLHPHLKQQTDGGYGLSHYAGNALVLGYRMPPFPQGFTDGPSQTIMMGEVSTNLKPWGHPVGWRDLSLGLHRSPHGFGGPTKGITYFALGDGSVRGISDTISPETLKAASTPASNDVLGDDW